MISSFYQIIEGIDPEDALKELKTLGLQHIFCIEDDATGDQMIGGVAEKSLPIPKLSILSEQKQTETINWAAQWEQFAENFYDGQAHIDLSKFGAQATLVLHPGPGFGDLSHPTTYLMLQLLQYHVHNQSILDIGCGSGILALAALLLGAKAARGVDIDPNALAHARENARLNHLIAHFSLRIPAYLLGNHIMLMNMIISEQTLVMRQKKTLNRLAKLWIVSGILREQKEQYLEITARWGWHLIECLEREGWLGFLFATSKK